MVMSDVGSQFDNRTETNSTTERLNILRQTQLLEDRGSKNASPRLPPSAAQHANLRRDSARPISNNVSPLPTNIKALFH